MGLEDVNRFLALLAELVRRGWKDDAIAKVAGENLLRVMAATEALSVRLQRAGSASTATIAQLDGLTATK